MRSLYNLAILIVSDSDWGVLKEFFLNIFFFLKSKIVTKLNSFIESVFFFLNDVKFYKGNFFKIATWRYFFFKYALNLDHNAKSLPFVKLLAPAIAIYNYFFLIFKHARIQYFNDLYVWEVSTNVWLRGEVYMWYLLYSIRGVLYLEAGWFFFNDEYDKLLWVNQLRHKLKYPLHYRANFEYIEFDSKLEHYSPSLTGFYLFAKNTLLALAVFLLSLTYSFYIYNLPFLKVISFWAVVILIVYWLLSGFNFFLKRYRFGKFTSALQRFWKRAFMCFWMIEGFLFALFVYYILNSSSEPIFMYDQVALYNNQLLSWRQFVFNSFLVVFTINILVVSLVSFNYHSFRQNLTYSVLITFFLLIVLCSESYQFYYIINFYDDSFWVFSDEDNVWELEYDSPRTRTKNHYLTLCIVAKFWHYIFIFASWVFFLMKTLQTGRFRYTFFSMNLQNIIIFYLMNWIFMYNWLKWFFRRFLDKPYYWFFVSNRDNFITILLHDLSQLYSNFIFYIFNCELFSFSFRNVNFYYLYLSEFYFHRGDSLKNFFISEIF